jgi:hypothetical protein
MTPEEQENLVQELETALDRLQALYNQYFMGIERLEPAIQHKEVVRKMQALRRDKISNTALRFRFQTQVQKYSTQSNYWKRICRQIEEGTYQRDINRAQKRGERRNEAEVAEKALRSLEGDAAAPRAGSIPVDTGLELDDPFSEPAAGNARPSGGPLTDDPDKTPVPTVGSGVHPAHEQILRSARDDAEEDEDEGELSTFFQKRPSLPPPPGPTKPAPPMPPAKPLPRPTQRAAEPTKPLPRPTQRAAEPKDPERTAPAAKLSEERMKEIYRAYVTARKKTNEPTDSLTFAKIAALLKKQTAEKADIKDFKVVIRNGKAIIKTVKE